MLFLGFIFEASVFVLELLRKLQDYLIEFVSFFLYALLLGSEWFQSLIRFPNNPYQFLVLLFKSPNMVL